ncbi:EAL domain-containing protein [Actinoplanes sp. NPDC089786]|uniref:EAL domain-containing protein n=1 Tax=Actinoplanes sp. NPDC089786 TaxID=3155185 RepID=UPI00342DA9EE
MAELLRAAGFTADKNLGKRDKALMEALSRAASLLIEPDMRRRVQHAEIAARIAPIVAAGGPVVLLQPIVDLDSGDRIGAEALSRFPRQWGLPPDRCFADAHMIGEGHRLELLALRRAADHLAHVRGYVAMNVSPSTLLIPECTDLLSRLPTDRVVLELSEHDPVDDYDQLRAVLAPLRAAGMRLAIDDVGAGSAGRATPLPGRSRDTSAVSRSTSARRSESGGVTMTGGSSRRKRCWGLVVLAPVVGATVGALDVIRALFASDRKPFFTSYARMSDSPGARHWLVEAATLTRRAERTMLALAAALDADAIITDEQGSRMQQDRADAAADCRAALERMLDLPGASGFRPANALRRFWLDVSVASRHPGLNPYLAIEDYGRALTTPAE